MLRRKDDEAPAREVSLWLERNEIPLQKYVNLPPGLKKALLGELSIPRRNASPTQREDLYKALCLPAGGRDFDPDDFVPPDEELKKRFAPVNRSEKLSYWQMF